jgi:hypothetical protein
MLACFVFADKGQILLADDRHHPTRFTTTHHLYLTSPFKIVDLVHK